MRGPWEAPTTQDAESASKKLIHVSTELLRTLKKGKFDVVLYSRPLKVTVNGDIRV